MWGGWVTFCGHVRKKVFFCLALSDVFNILNGFVSGFVIKLTFPFFDLFLKLVNFCNMNLTTFFGEGTNAITARTQR